MKVIGVIGGIGTGKSTISNILKAEGGYIISSDEVSHRILEPDGAAYDEVLSEFGTIERAELAAIVFADRAALERLNRITHKHIAKAIKDEMEAVLATDESEFIVLEVPLPVKEGFLDMADVVWAVTADEPTRIKRLCEQRGFAEADARARIANQPPESVYAALADAVIDNSAEFSPDSVGAGDESCSLRQQVLELLRELD